MWTCSCKTQHFGWKISNRIERDCRNPFRVRLADVPSLDRRSLPVILRAFPDGVETVSWEDAVEFCRRLSDLPEEKAAGRVYRLSTEAQWEYACRAGTTTAYSFGDDASKLGDCAWFGENSGGSPHPVGRKKPNSWGLYDMHGNVWEWCSDWYDQYPSGAVTDPTGPQSGLKRVNLGGCYSRPAADSRLAVRGKHLSSKSFPNLGFRVVCGQSGQ